MSAQPIAAGLGVLDAGTLTTVQDAGRWGLERFGVPVGGAMDEFALAAANRLVGNPPDAAALECVGAGPLLRAGRDTLAAAGGAGFALVVDGRRFPLWMAVRVRRGQRVGLTALSDDNAPGVWGVLAFAGGVDVPPVLGSRTTYLRGGFGGMQGRALQTGDILPLGRPSLGAWERAGDCLREDARPAYSLEPVLQAVVGPQAEAFLPQALEVFFHSSYQVLPASDRMGYRLAGPKLIHAGAADILSEGLARGAVQVPGDGQPIVLLADRQTTGGYTKIAVVARASLPLLVQCPPGRGRVRFQPVEAAQAQQSWRQMCAACGAAAEDAPLTPV